jgi:hypothetical protein
MIQHLAQLENLSFHAMKANAERLDTDQKATPAPVVQMALITLDTAARRGTVATAVHRVTAVTVGLPGTVAMVAHLDTAAMVVHPATVGTAAHLDIVGTEALVDAEVLVALVVRMEPGVVQVDKVALAVVAVQPELAEEVVLLVAVVRQAQRVKAEEPGLLDPVATLELPAKEAEQVHLDLVVEPGAANAATFIRVENSMACSLHSTPQWTVMDVHSTM